MPITLPKKAVSIQDSFLAFDYLLHPCPRPGSIALLFDVIICIWIRVPHSRTPPKVCFSLHFPEILIPFIIVHRHPEVFPLSLPIVHFLCSVKYIVVDLLPYFDLVIPLHEDVAPRDFVTSFTPTHNAALIKYGTLRIPNLVMRVPN